MRQETRDKRQGHFLQSRDWEGFERSLGRKVFRIEGALFIKFPLAFGKSYLYVAGVSNFPPFGRSPVGRQFFPLWGIPRRGTTFNFKTIAKKTNAVFLKVEPMAEDKSFADELRKAGFRKAKKEIQPQRTIVLDLTKTEEELLGEMHQKARYNIRVAEKHGVKFSSLREVSRRETIFPPMGDTPQGDNFQTLEKFWKLMQKTARRDKFSSHTREHYERLLKLPIVHLFTTEYQGKIIAANTVLFYGDTAYYLHGASDYEYRNLMAPYLLHWETMKYAKERGYRYYDLWGIDEKKWAGLTRFKLGFGGKEVEYIGSYDCVFQPPWYMLYLLHKKLF